MLGCEARVTRLQQWEKHNESCFPSKKKKKIKIRDLLIINRRGLVSLCNGWCYHLCQICTPQQDCAGNRISTRVKILQICAQWWSLSRYTTWPWIKFASLQCLSFGFLNFSQRKKRKHGRESLCSVSFNWTELCVQCKPLQMQTPNFI